MDSDCVIHTEDNSINETFSVTLRKSRSVDVARYLRSSSNEILAAVDKKTPVKVACWNVRTGMLENVKQDR